ncbi:hypothetical protein Tco_1184508 [Tanacetum coccineum]
MAALQYKETTTKSLYWGGERGCEDTQISSAILDHSPLSYALTHSPPVRELSLVKQFEAHVVCPNAAGFKTYDNLEGYEVIGYPTDRALTFLKHHLSPQWRFLVHTLMHCLSPKSGSWNQFPSSIATALICLSTDRVYNFSRFIIEGMIGNVKATKNKFLMYPRFLQMIVAIETADRTPRPTFGFTRKLFANMKFKWEGQPMPLTPPCLPLLLLAMLLMRKIQQPMNVSPLTQSSLLLDWRPWPSVPKGRLVVNTAASCPFFLLTDWHTSAGGFISAARVCGPAAYYLEPEDLDNLLSMEDDTTHGGFHVESPVRPDDAPTPTANAASRAEDPVLLTSLSAKLDSF